MLLKILIVDDEYVSLTKLNLLLERYGDCDSATSGEQALELINLAIEEKKPYDLITMDISMNGQDGIETLKNIRQIQSYGENVIIVMITGMTDKMNIGKSFKEGCTELITKPVVRKEVEMMLEKLNIPFREKSVNAG